MLEDLEELLDERNVALDALQLGREGRLVGDVGGLGGAVSSDGGRGARDGEVLHLHRVEVRLLGELVRGVGVEVGLLGVRRGGLERGVVGLLGALFVDEAFQEVVEELNDLIALLAEPCPPQPRTRLAGGKRADGEVDTHDRCTPGGERWDHPSPPGDARGL